MPPHTPAITTLGDLFNCFAIFFSVLLICKFNEFMTIPIYCPDEIYQEMKDGFVSQKITEK